MLKLNLVKENPDESVNVALGISEERRKELDAIIRPAVDKAIVKTEMLKEVIEQLDDFQEAIFCTYVMASFFERPSSKDMIIQMMMKSILGD